MPSKARGVRAPTESYRRFPLRGSAHLAALLIAVTTLLVVSSGGAVGPSIGHPLLHPASPVSAPVAIGAADLEAAYASLHRGHGPVADASLHSLGTQSSISAIGQTISLAYDAADGYVVAIAPNVTGSGNTSGWGNISQTWTFLHGNWTMLPLSFAPPNRGYAAMTYDPVDGYVVLFGGDRFGGTYGYNGLLGDTWSFHNGSWTNLSATLAVHPSPRAQASMAWDASDGYVVLVGGVGTSGNISGNLSETWEYVSGAWTKGPSAPGLAVQGSLAYDAADGYVVYFGGDYAISSVTYLSNATWEYHAGAWTSLASSITTAPPGRTAASMTYDPNLNALLLFGGLGQSSPNVWHYYNDTWAYANLTWTLLSSASGPSPREMASMVFDATDNETILVGGVNYLNSTTYGDTWAFGPAGNASNASSSSSWAQAAPHLRASRALDDVGAPITYNVNGVQGSSGTFTYTGLPPGCASSDTSELTCVPTGTGTYWVTITAQTSSGIARAETIVTVIAAPALGPFSVSSDLTEIGAPIAFATSETGGIGPIDWSYAGLPTGCASVDAGNMSCAPTVAGTFSVSVTASDTLGLTASATTTLLVLATPALTSFSASPSTIDAGQMTTLSAQAFDGRAPYTFTFSGVPSGCAPAGTGSLQCTPTVPGTYSVGVVATDNLGFTAGGRTTLLVNADPTIGSFSAGVPNVTVNQPVTLHVVTSGGTGPLTYAYFGLPPGCVGANVSTVECTPTVVGNYSIDATVSDTVGMSASVLLSLAVDPVPFIRTPGGGTGSHLGGSSNSSTSTTNVFYAGVALGLVALVVAIVALLRRARETREGRALVEELRRSPVPEPAQETSEAAPLRIPPS